MNHFLLHASLSLSPDKLYRVFIINLANGIRGREGASKAIELVSSFVAQFNVVMMSTRVHEAFYFISFMKFYEVCKNSLGEYLPLRKI